MAIIYRQHLGKIKGKLGSTVVQKRFGKQVVSIRPDHYKKTNSAKLKAVRKEFAVKVLFAKAINQNPLLVQCWKNCTHKSISGYHKALSYNSKFIVNEVTTKNNVITPPDMYYPDANKVKFLDSIHYFTDNKISFNFKITLNSGITDFAVPYVCVLMLVLIHSDGKAERITTLMLQKDIDTLETNPEGNSKVDFIFTEEESEIIKKYRLLRGYLAFVKPDSVKPKNTDWSFTNFFEVNLNEFYKQNK
jgi:hypothetical protein